MVALRCPMCCKRKFKTQMSLKYHILSYMYNIFCTLCSRRVGNLQELIDHLEAGCEKAYSASSKNVPVVRNAIAQTQENLLNTKALQEKNVHNAEEVHVEEVGGLLSVGSNNNSADFQGDMIQNLLDSQMQAVPVEESSTQTNVLNSNDVTKTSSSQLFTCSMCCTTFSCLEEHVKLYHSEQDVEVHKQDSSVVHFWKSRGKDEAGQAVQACVSSTAPDSELGSHDRDASNEGDIEQSEADGDTGSQCSKQIDSILGRALNCDSSTNSMGNSSADHNFKLPVKPLSNSSFENSRNISNRNNRDTEHAYSTRRDRTKPYAVPRVVPCASQSTISLSSTEENNDAVESSNGVKGKMLCVCSPSNHHSQCKENKKTSAAIEFSEAIPKLFSQKIGIPTVVVLNGDKLTSILTPMTSSLNPKALQKCNSLDELISTIGSQTQRTFPKTQRTNSRAIVKSTGESVYRDRFGMFYTRKLVPNLNVPSSEVQSPDVPRSDAVHDSSAEPELNCPQVDESNICLTSKETSQESCVDVDDGGKHRLETSCIRKKIRNEREFIIQKIVGADGKFLDNIYTCQKCNREFQKYLAFCKHDCEKETDKCSCPDCDNQWQKKRILTIHFKDIEPEVDSQKAMIEIGLGLSSESELQTTKDNNEENILTNVTDNVTKGSEADAKITASKRRRKTKAPKKVSPPQTFVCNTCSTVFTKKLAFVNHVRMHAPKVVRIERNEDGTPVDYTCKICSFVAEHKRGLKQHMRIHFPEEYEKRQSEKRLQNAKKAEQLELSTTSEQQKEAIEVNNCDIDSMTMVCKLCGKVFSKQIHLYEHLRSHSYNVVERAEKQGSLADAAVERAVASAPHTFTCEICSKTLDIVFRQMHIDTHFGDERFTCDICNENLYTRQQFNLHMRAHKGDNPYLCRVCRKKFGSLEELDRHALSHNGTKRYPCRFCDRWFQRPIHKVEHERLHTGEKPFSCNYCGMKFRLRCSRELHVRIHTGLKPYCCKVCKKRFRSQINHRAHVAIHSDERNYKCSICPKTFKTAVSLSSHKNNHTKPYKCQICKRRFETSYSERQHRKSHSAAKSTLKYKCTICGFMYARPFGLRDHMLTHSSELDASGDKSNKVSELREILEDECTQTADMVFEDVNDECMEAAEFLVVNLKEDSFQGPKSVVNIANKDQDYVESMYAVTEDFTNEDGCLVAHVENQQSVEFLVVETSEGVSDSQFFLTVAEEESVEVPRLELQDMYDKCRLFKVANSNNENHNTHSVGVGLSNYVSLASMNMEENVCVIPVPVNFEEVNTEVDSEALRFA